jgi:hypothetical protein
MALVCAITNYSQYSRSFLFYFKYMKICIREGRLRIGFILFFIFLAGGGLIRRVEAEMAIRIS